MKYKNMLDKFCLGTANFGMNYGVMNDKQIPKSEIVKFLNILKKSNINYIDTAMGYGDCEKILGEIGIENFEIITKLPSVICNDINVKKCVVKLIDTSLERLQKSSLQGLLLHRPLDLLSKKGEIIYKTLVESKSVGLIKKIGVSIYSPNDLVLLSNYFDFDIVQTPHNVLDNRLEHSGWLDKLHKRKIEVHTRSIFLQGILISDMEKLPTSFLKWSNVFKNWKMFVNETELSPLEICLKNSFQNKKISKIILGIDNQSQLYTILNHIKKFKKDDILIPDEIRSNDEYLINPSKW